MTQKKVLSKDIIDKCLKKRIPLSCQFDLTYKCNLNCIHCYVKESPLKELETSAVKKILKDLASEGTLYICFSGGEIFKRDDVVDILRYARKKHFSIRILTNGTLIDGDLVDELAELYLNMIGISLYSMDPNIHDNITQIPGSHKKALNTIKLFKNKDLPLRINFTVLNKNLNEYNKVYEFSNKIGSLFKIDHQITPRLDGNPHPTKYQTDDLGMKKIITDLQDYSKSQDNSDALHEYSSDFYDVLCLAGHSYLYISPYGDVFPCVQFPLKCGDLKETSFNDIWQNSPEFKWITSLKMSDLKQCSQCDLNIYCRYCPGYAYLEEENLLLPPSRNCIEAKLYQELTQISSLKDE